IDAAGKPDLPGHVTVVIPDHIDKIIIGRRQNSFFCADGFCDTSTGFELPRGRMPRGPLRKVSAVVAEENAAALRAAEKYRVRRELIRTFRRAGTGIDQTDLSVISGVKYNAV